MKVYCHAGSGLSDRNRQLIWDRRKTYLDSEVRVVLKYDCLTKENDKGIRSLRFPRVVEILDDGRLMDAINTEATGSYHEGNQSR